MTGEFKTWSTKVSIITNRRCRLSAVLIAVYCISHSVFIAGCNTAAPAGGSGAQPAQPNDSASLEDLQGEWLYLRAEGDQLISGDCIIIEDDQVAEFIDNCDGEDLLLSSSDITTNGGTFVLRLVIEVTIPDEPAESLEITTTLAQEGDIFVGTEVTDPPVPLGDQIVLRRPEA